MMRAEICSQRVLPASLREIATKRQTTPRSGRLEKRDVMSFKSPTNLQGKDLPLIASGENTEPVLFPISATRIGTIPAACNYPCLSEILALLMESDGHVMEINQNKEILRLDWRELVSQLRAAIRHWDALAGSRVTRFGDVCVDFSKMDVSRSSGARVALTPQEFRTLRFFVLNPGRVVSRDEFLNHAWGYNCYPCTRTVDNHVLKLRQKLELNPSRPVHFRTVHGFGYKFVP